MICYRDMTFCSFYTDCANAPECHRPLTPEIIAAAVAHDLPISQFMKAPWCHKETEPCE